MNEKKSTLKLLFGVIVVLVIRGIGIENIPFGIVVAILIFGIAYFMWSIFNFKIDKKEEKYFRSFAVSLILLIITFAIMYTIQHKFPQYMALSKPILTPIFITTYGLVAASVLVWVIMRNRK